MKKLIIFLMVIFAVSLSYCVNVSAEQYILKLRDEPLMKMDMSASKLEMADTEENIYLADNYEVAKPYIDAGMAEFAEPNYELELFYNVDKSCYNNLWQVEMVKTPYFWNTGCFGKDIRVAVVDTGVYQHDDIKANLLTGYNYVDNTNDTNDVISHGTFVSGLIAALPNTAGMVGVSPRAKIVPLKCFNDETQKASSLDMANAVKDAVDKYGCKVINLSCGMETNSLMLKSAVDYAVGKGAIIVAAVGNEGTSTLQYPAAYDNAIGVGAVSSGGTVASFSQKNNSVYVSAPGSYVKSLDVTQSLYRYGSGTSFSTPIVSALAVLACEMDDTMNNDKFKEVLKNTAVDCGEPGYDTSYGYGLVDAKKIRDYILAGKDCFVSDADTETDGSSSVTIYNNRDDMLDVSSVWTFYGEDKFELSGVKKTNLLLQPKSSVIINSGSVSENMKHMLWYNKTLMPAYEVKVAN